MKDGISVGTAYMYIVVVESQKRAKSAPLLMLKYAPRRDTFIPHKQEIRRGPNAPPNPNHAVSTKEKIVEEENTARRSAKAVMESTAILFTSTSSEEVAFFLIDLR